MDGGAGDFDGGVVLLGVVDNGVDEAGVSGVAVFDDEELGLAPRKWTRRGLVMLLGSV